MGKKKKLIEEEEPIEVKIEEEKEDENVELSSFLNEFAGSEFRIDVRKLSKDGSVWERVKTIPLDQFSPDLIAETYGGGKYRFRVIDPQGKFVRQFTCTYAEPVKNVEVKEDRNNHKDDLMLQVLLNQLNSNNQMLIEMIRNFRIPEQKEQFKITDMISLIASIKQLFPQQNLSELIELLRTGIDLGQSVSSGETSTFDKLIDIFSKIYTQRLDLVKQKIQKEPVITNPINDIISNTNVDNKSKNEIQKVEKEPKIILPENELENKIFTLFAPYKGLLKQCFDNNIPTGMVSLYVYNICDDGILNDIFNYFSEEKNIQRFSEYAGVSKEYIKTIVQEIKNYAMDILQNE